MPLACNNSLAVTRELTLQPLACESGHNYPSRTGSFLFIFYLFLSCLWSMVGFYLFRGCAQSQTSRICSWYTCIAPSIIWNRGMRNLRTWRLAGITTCVVQYDHKQCSTVVIIQSWELSSITSVTIILPTSLYPPKVILMQGTIPQWVQYSMWNYVCGSWREYVLAWLLALCSISFNQILAVKINTQYEKHTHMHPYLYIDKLEISLLTILVTRHGSMNIRTVAASLVSAAQSPSLNAKSRHHETTTIRASNTCQQNIWHTVRIVYIDNDRELLTYYRTLQQWKWVRCAIEKQVRHF